MLYECIQTITYCIPVRFSTGQYEYLWMMILQGTTGSFNNVGNPVAQLDF
jgi:hypothetical protein